MRAYYYNPLTEYLRFVANRFGNRRRFTNFDQAYLAIVKRTSCGPNFRVGHHSLIIDCSIGGYSYVSHDTEIVFANIGRFCSIGPGCRIGLGIHPTDHVSTSPVFFSTRKQAGISFTPADVLEENKQIMIGNDVWIGANAMILDGVEIGTGAIVAAGSVVTKDVAPYTIVAGVPAVPKRKRFSDEQIGSLLQSCWWDWTPEKLSKNGPKFSNADQFIEEVLSRGAEDL
jgi:acetyltransferase-like isoleucine patch superfamily enzyme